MGASIAHTCFEVSPADRAREHLEGRQGLEASSAHSRAGFIDAAGQTWVKSKRLILDSWKLKHDVLG